MYSKEYYESIERWEDIAGLSLDELKGYLHTPYTIHKDFSSTQSTIISKNNSELRCLDFGCGIGRNLPFLKKISKIVDGYDLPAMLKRCSGYDNLYDDWKDCVDNEYDIVFDMYSLQFIPDLNAIKDILQHFSTRAKYFHITTRSYADDKDSTNIIKLILNSGLFDIISCSHPIDIFSNIDFPDVTCGEFMFKTKGQDIVPRIILKSEEHNITYDTNHTDIAFLDQYNVQSIAGSQYYNLLLMYSLLNIGYNVTWYHNENINSLENNLYQYYGDTINNNFLTKVLVKAEADIPNAKFFFCTAESDKVFQAIEMAAKYNKPIYIVIYDCSTWFNTEMYEHISSLYCERRAEEFKHNIYCAKYFYKQLKKHIHHYLKDIPQLKIISLTDNIIDDLAKFYDLDKEHFISISPSVNNRIRDSITIQNKKNQIIVINRNDWNKALDETMRCFKPFSNDYILHIITDDKDNIKQYDIDQRKVIVHTNISDADKFILLKESKLLISNSFFEGFGMWSIEALSCGTPVVCYDLPSLKDITCSGLHKIPRYDVEAFSYKMNEVLNSNVIFTPVKEYDFDVQVEETASKIQIPISDMSSFTKLTNKTYDISTKFDTTPSVFHFNSIYNINTCTHFKTTIKCWNKILNNMQKQPQIKIPKNINIFTFCNKPIKSILELSCELQNIPLTILGKSIQLWNHNDRIQHIIDYLESIGNEYVLHIDALDAVINRDIDNLPDDKVLFNAEGVCHPASAKIEELQEAKTIYSPFKYLNAGVFCGKRKNVIEIFKLANTYKKYGSSNPMCDDCDQGKLNQVYIDTDMIEIDSKCRMFYCNDYKTNAKKFLRFKEVANV